jgi:hypothetical protein
MTSSNKRRTRIGGLTLGLAGLVLAGSGGVALANENEGRRPVTDKPKVVDFAAVKRALAEAKKPLRAKLAETQLKERFEEVAKVVEAEDLDLDALQDSLTRLGAELELFLEDWDRVTEPLHTARDTVGDTVGRIRTYLAGGDDDKARRKNTQRIQQYEERLGRLATDIQRETDPVRRDRLRTVFGFLLRIKGELEQHSLPAAGDKLRRELYEPMVDALGELDFNLELAGLHAERSRVKLDAAKETVRHYSDVVTGLIEAQEIAGEVAEFLGRKPSEASLDFGSLVEQLGGFSRQMERTAGVLTDQVAEKTDQLSNTLTRTVDLSDVDVDSAVERYAKKYAEEKPAAKEESR